ncbi:hypothetical protein FF1_002847 [Malus domestica]
MLLRAKSIGVTFYARADKERCAMQFRLVQARSFSVAFYACADKKRCAMQFRLVQTRSFVGSSSDPGESFLVIFIAMSLD